MREDSFDEELAAVSDVGAEASVSVADEIEGRSVHADMDYVEACAVAQALHSADELIEGMNHEERLGLILGVVDSISVKLGASGRPEQH